MVKNLQHKTLIMPSTYSVMDDEEMMYMEGGAQVYLSTKMYNKDYCLSIAKDYTAETGLSNTRIAQEIFAHAILFLGGAVMDANAIINKLPFADSISTYILEHSNPVDIGGDAWYRVAAYKAIWFGVPSLA